ncbi:C40 family peptidase [Salinibacterium sp. G-O1]|uniref:C40 family peptidase n=1 Tax=Salinibacterium sp. G-O1 TaxID=3046208 RepID=UPI0024BBD5F4|nr:C40 family peptidase [Salinibacterium sp. G-O1]MDJ0333895.1 C40 family peptidase [Salinibacterium sp. G-O1]
MPARRRPLGALTIVVSASLMLTLGLASSAAAVEYPSWDDVQNARQNQATTAATAAEIERYLVTLETEAANLGRAAQIKGESYNVARDALDVASTKAERLDEQAQDAAARAEQSSRRAGQIISQLARTGGGNLSLSLVLSPDAGNMLGSLGSMTKLTEQTAHLLDEATQDKNVASALTAQAKTAEKARTALAQDAQTAFDDANAASAVVVARIASQQAAADQLYAQLAALKGTTAEVERLYIEGKTDVRPVVPTAPIAPSVPRPTPTQPSTPGSVTPPVVTPPVVVAPPVVTPPVVTPPVVAPPVVTPPVVAPPVVAPPVTPAPAPAPAPSAVEAAIAFATAQLGDRYQYGGYGPDAWDCSGLTKASYAAAGVYIGAHGSTSQYRYLSGQGRLVPISQMQRGDLIFYSGDGSYVYHTGLYIGGGRMIEAQYEGIPVKIATVRSYDLMSYVARPTG